MSEGQTMTSLLDELTADVSKVKELAALLSVLHSHSLEVDLSGEASDTSTLLLDAYLRMNALRGDLQVVGGLLRRELLAQEWRPKVEARGWTWGGFHPDKGWSAVLTEGGEIVKERTGPTPWALMAAMEGGAP